MLVDFGRFFGAKLTPKTDKKLISTLNTKNQLNASRLAFSWLYVLEVDLKNPLKIDEKSIRKCHSRWKASILLHFARKSSLRRLQDGPRRPKRRQDTAQSPPRHLRDAPRRSQDASQDAPGTTIKSPRHDQNAPIASKIDFYGFLIDFWSIFDGFWVDF